MLILSRKPGEKVYIDGGIEVEVLSVQGRSVKIGIKAPDHVTIVRDDAKKVYSREKD